MKRLHYRMYRGFSFERKSSESQITIDFKLTQWTNMQRTLCIEKLYFRHFDQKDIRNYANQLIIKSAGYRSQQIALSG